MTDKAPWQALFSPASTAFLDDTTGGAPLARTIARNLQASPLPRPPVGIGPGAQALGFERLASTLEELGTPEKTDGGLDLLVYCGPPDRLMPRLAAVKSIGCRAITWIDGGRGVTARPNVTAEAVTTAAAQLGIAVLGPNGFGYRAIQTGLNVSLSSHAIEPGRLAVISQSAGVMAALVDWALPRSIGFSHLICLGNSGGIGLDACLDYLTTDRYTNAIMMHVRSIRSARSFMSAARAASRIKPLVVLRSGLHGDQLQAVEDEPIISDDAVYHAAFRRAGMLRVRFFENLLEAAQTLDSGTPVHGDGLVILTNTRGLAEMTIDDFAFGDRATPPLPASLNAAAEAAGLATIPARGVIDIGEEASAEDFSAALDLVLADAAVDALLVAHSPVMPGMGEAAADVLIKAIGEGKPGRARKTPVFTAFLGGAEGAAARARLDKAHIATYETPDQAVRAYGAVRRYQRNQALLLEAPPRTHTPPASAVAEARQIIEQALERGETSLGVRECDKVLSLYGIPVLSSVVAATPIEAAAEASRMGFPVAVKGLIPGLNQRSRYGAVVLNLDTAQNVEEACQAIS
ncbi:MAG: acetate--CoA ligase family protein, partial [Pseudomonadota bacterium]